jgi:hypothetical protein
MDRGPDAERQNGKIKKNTTKKKQIFPEGKKGGRIGLTIFVFMRRFSENSGASNS